MFHTLSSLTKLCIRYAGTDYGRERFRSIPRDTELSSLVQALEAGGKRFTGSSPNSDAMAAALLGFLS